MKKTCSTCKEEKNLSDFRKDKSNPDGHQYCCKVCAREYHKSQYSIKYGIKSAERSKNRRLVARAIIDDARAAGCVKCDEKDLCCLEFHHVDPSQKDFQVGGHGINRSLAKIKAELEKCVVLCSNCHKKIHSGSLSL